MIQGRGGVCKALAREDAGRFAPSGALHRSMLRHACASHIVAQVFGF